MASLFREEDRKIFEDLIWLRYLEVELNDDEVSNLRESKKFKRLGKTPFTKTKLLRKDDEDYENFGLQIRWTKPISIVSVVESSPAEKSHIEKGDLIIFIDNVNIVDKPQKDILDLINKDDSLILEVFRQAKMQLEKVVTIESESSVCNEETKSPVVVGLKKNKLGSSDSTKKKLTFFSKDESNSSSIDSQRSPKLCKLLQNLASLEKQFMDSLTFGQTRYIQTLSSRKDLISCKDHEILFENIVNIKSVMEKICLGGPRENLGVFVQSYRMELTNFKFFYDRYFESLKAADKIVVEKTHYPNFIKFITNPPIPTNQPLFHNFIQKPFEFYQDLQSNLQIVLGQYKVDSLEYQDLNYLISKLQVPMKPEPVKKTTDSKVDTKPLLKSLESRLVFVKCKPFHLDIPERVFIFAGDLTRVSEKAKEFPTYTLLFNDILLFSTINRDRVLFITEEPINLKSITESFFNVRKKENEFRLIVETNPNYKDMSPTTRCTISRSPFREQSKKICITLRAESEEIKKVWQSFISHSVFKINNSFSENNFENINQILNPSNQTEILSTKREIEIEKNNCSPHRTTYNKSNQLNLISQNAVEQFETPETPSTPKTPDSLPTNNEKLRKSLSFSSSIRNESCEGIFEFDFECDLFSSDVCNESIFIEDSFVDES